MTPERAASLIAYEQPSARGQCDRCYAVRPVYVEPEHLFDAEPGARLCVPCVGAIAARRARGPEAVSLDFAL